MIWKTNIMNNDCFLLSDARHRIDFLSYIRPNIISVYNRQIDKLEQKKYERRIVLCEKCWRFQFENIVLFVCVIDASISQCFCKSNKMHVSNSSEKKEEKHKIQIYSNFIKKNWVSKTSATHRIYIYHQTHMRYDFR